MKRIATVSAWLFLVLGALNAAFLFSIHRGIEEAIRFGFSFSSAYLDEYIRNLISILLMIILLLLARPQRARGYRILGLLVFAFMVGQCFLSLRLKFETVGYFERGDFYWKASLVADVLILALGSIAGSGLLIDSFGLYEEAPKTSLRDDAD